MVELVLQLVKRCQLLVVEGLKLGEMRAELLVHAVSRMSFDVHPLKLPQPQSKCKLAGSHKAGFIEWPPAMHATPADERGYASRCSVAPCIGFYPECLFGGAR